MPDPAPTFPRVETDPEAMLDGETDREVLLDGAGKSGAHLERVRIKGQPHVVKYVDLADDWTMRAAGDLGGVARTLWSRGLLAALPGCFNQPIIGVADVRGTSTSGPSGGCALLMRDVASWLVAVSDDPIPIEQHLRFLEHMAAMHATFWGGGDEIEVVPVMHRYLELSPWTAQAEQAIGSDHLVPRLVGEGWALLASIALIAAAIVTPLAWDPSPLVIALEGHGIDTEPWWDRQLTLCLLGALVQFGWEKALGGYDEELAWWEARAVAAAPLLAR